MRHPAPVDPDGYPHPVDTTGLDARIAALDPSDPETMTRSEQALAGIIGRHGQLPTLEHYRRVYADLTRRFGIEWPGDDQVRAMFPVAP